jgi:hypothetical protein
MLTNRAELARLLIGVGPVGMRTRMPPVRYH